MPNPLWVLNMRKNINIRLIHLTVNIPSQPRGRLTS